MDKGYRRVRPLVGGLDAWIESGRAVETGELPRI
jgi:3-mercaptopyruvate sulfurtransferase SseA